jgi:hypothetical protein
VDGAARGANGCGAIGKDRFCFYFACLLLLATGCGASKARLGSEVSGDVLLGRRLSM